MKQSTKLLLAFGGSALAGNLVGRAIVSGAPPSANSPRLFQFGTAAVAIVGGAIAYSLRNDSFGQSKDIAFQAAIIGGLFGGAGVATLGMETAPAAPTVQQMQISTPAAPAQPDASSLLMLPMAPSQPKSVFGGSITNEGTLSPSKPEGF